MKHDHIINVHEYHKAKQRQEIIETRIIGGLVIICFFIIMPLLSHYL